MMRYEVKPDGSLGAGALFTEGPGIGDGMKADRWATSTRRAARAPASSGSRRRAASCSGYLNLPIYGGEPKRQICATNVAFGDADGKSLYVTACDVVYRIKMKVAGVMPGPKS